MTTDVHTSYVSFDEHLQAAHDNLLGGLSGRVPSTLAPVVRAGGRRGRAVDEPLLGWGTTSESQINPQSTAEALVALLAVEERLGAAPSLTPEELARVLATIQLRTVPGEAGGADRHYDSPVDWSWRIQGLLAVRWQAPALVPDEMLQQARAELLGWFNPGVGGFRINRGDQDCSVFATSLALEALLALEHDACLPPDEDTRRAADGSVKYLRGKLKSALTGSQDEAAVHVYRVAYPLRALAQRALRRGKHGPDEPTIISAITWLRTRIARSDFPPVEDSLLDRPSNRQDSGGQGGYGSPSVWQHLCLPLALEAILIGDNSLDQQAPTNTRRRGLRRRALTHPGVQLALVRLGQLQEAYIPHTKGGFKTSQYGTVTCYATTASTQALLAARDTITQYFSPGEVWTIVATHSGGYSADARSFNLGRRRGRPVEIALNQGAVLLWLASLLLTWGVLLLALPDPGRDPSDRLSVNLAVGVLAATFSALTAALLAVRWPNLSPEVLASVGLGLFPLSIAAAKVVL